MASKVYILSQEHGGTYSYTGYKESFRNNKNPFYSNPYIYTPNVNKRSMPKSRNTDIGTGGFMTQTQVNSVMKDLVAPKDQMKTTYKLETDRALTAKYKKLFLPNKPVVSIK